MFRLQNNVPSTYVEKSRDFQLLLRLIDGLQGSIKYSIDSMINVLDPFKIRDDLLNLLSIKVGFFPSFDIESTTLKNIVAAFPYVIKNKGSEAGIKAAVRAILKSEFSNSTGIELDPENNPRVVIYNGGASDPLKYSIEIYTDISEYNLKVLQEVMEYIRPIGYNYNIINTPSSTISVFSGEEYLRDDKIITYGIVNNARLAKIIPNQFEKSSENIEEPPYITTDITGTLVSGHPFGMTRNLTSTTPGLINTAPVEHINYQLSKHAMVVTGENLPEDSNKDPGDEEGVN